MVKKIWMVPWNKGKKGKPITLKQKQILLSGYRKYFDNKKNRLDVNEKIKDYYKVEENLLKNRIKKTCIKVIIDSIEYQSVRDSVRTLNIPRTTIRYRLKSIKYPNYKYL